MNPERVKAFFQDQTIESEDISSEIDKILHTHDRLLIIGDPGAGKTTILLFAAVNILQDEQTQKLPLILNLATWQIGRDFKEWYAQSIAHTYNLSPVFVEELILRNAVVPFFDGYDEVVEDSREDCFEKMAAYFGDQRNLQLIVSSRKKEYAAAKADAPVYLEIEVQPLSLAQIRKALSENALTQAADRALLHALDYDKWLGKAVETPFYLNTASFLFGRGQRTLVDFPFKADSTEGRKEELVEVFVAEQVPEERDRKYLSFLAGKNEEENSLVFELVDMQPGGVGGVRMYRLVFVVFGNSGKIWTEDLQAWSWSFFLHSWRSALFGGLLGGLLGGLVFGLLGGLISGFLGNMVGGLIRGLAFGLAYGLVGGLFGGLKLAGNTTSFFLYIPRPYQRFWATLRNNFWPIPILILALLSGIFSVQVWEGTFSLDAWASATQYLVFWKMCLLTGFLSLLFPLINSQFPQHFSLRLVLYLEKKLPLRLVTFLDRMTDQHIFEDNRRTIKGKKQRGATWRFRHKILQDYFAKMAADPSSGSKP
ncbi:MAG: hypothetical protein IPH31_27370 [Lewinellaceae bacterium]|nr:hypothetical protein [Lewinellaceae bacterium]